MDRQTFKHIFLVVLIGACVAALIQLALILIKTESNFNIAIAVLGLGISIFIYWLGENARQKERKDDRFNEVDKRLDELAVSVVRMENRLNAVFSNQSAIEQNIRRLETLCANLSEAYKIHDSKRIHDGSALLLDNLSGTVLKISAQREYEIEKIKQLEIELRQLKQDG